VGYSGIQRETAGTAGYSSYSGIQRDGRMVVGFVLINPLGRGGDTEQINAPVVFSGLLVVLVERADRLFVVRCSQPDFACGG
jgi:hypothetical protein